jgi:hypothetical protein
LMLADRLKTTAIGLLALVVVLLIRRQVEPYSLSHEILNVINLATLFILCLIIVVIVRKWIPRRAKPE